MGQQVHPPGPVKLIVGMLSRQRDLLDAAETTMTEWWGPIDLRSETLPFDFTRYYEKEMGPDLWRRFVSFEQLIAPDTLADVKHRSNALEARFAAQAGGPPARPLNLDPGYVDAAKLVLATTKDYSHRVYLGQNIYAEATLSYRRNGWTPWPYTYPDYAGGAYFSFLDRVRTRLLEQRSSKT